MDEVKELIENLGADGYKRGEDWKGYEIYEPVYKQFGSRGLPLVVMVKGDEVRISTPEESLEYLDYTETNRA